MLARRQGLVSTSGYPCEASLQGLRAVLKRQNALIQSYFQKKRVCSFRGQAVVCISDALVYTAVVHRGAFLI